VTSRAWPVLASLVWVALDASAQDATPAVHFDTRLMPGARRGTLDLSRFERGEPIAPGLHALDVLRNGERIGRRTIRFAAADQATMPVACVDAPLADALGLAPGALSAEQRATLAAADPARCITLTSLVPQAHADYDAEHLALRVTLPQAFLATRPRDAIDPALRDAGIAAFRANYAFNAWHQDARAQGDLTYASAQVELGANAGRWRWRHRGTHAWRQGAGLRSNTLSTVLERDLDALEAQLTIGDFHTRGDVFDAMGLRGVRIASDDRMQPPSLLRYAPVVRGIASTQARVQVRQGTTLIYDTTVAPGPFALQDVQPLGYGGALDVRVIEADGQVASFSVPYAAIPGLLRPGQSRFGVAAGRWRGTGAMDGNATDLVFQGTVQRGVHDRLTLQAGAQVAPDYAQALGGIAVSTRVGAFSIDRAQSRLGHDGSSTTGHALRIAYAGRVPATHTTVDVAAWRHGSDGFRSLTDAMRHPVPIAGRREHTRTDASLRQSIGSYGGALTLGFVDRSWRAPTSRERSLRIGWGRSLPRGGLLQATFDHVLSGPHRTSSGAISLSLPLTPGGTRAVGHVQARVLEDTTTMLASASGTFGRDRRLGWSAGRTHTTGHGGNHATRNATLSTQGRAGRIRAGLSASRATRQWSATAEGGVLLHAHGVTFGQPMGDTVALVRAPHGRGASLLQHPVARLDGAGRGVVPHLSPYRRNTVGIDPRGASSDVQFDWTERSVVPRAGAVLDIALPTVRSTLHRLRALRADGAVVPFAAEVLAPDGTAVGTIGREGVVLLRAPAGTLTFSVRWQEAGEAKQCHLSLPSRTDAPGIVDTPCTE